MDWSGFKILLFDLDGTLLNSQKCISEMTARSIAQCKEKGLKIGVCTSRSEINSLVFLDKIKPDVIVSSGGALVNVAEMCIRDMAGGHQLPHLRAHQHRCGTDRRRGGRASARL